MKTGSKLPAPPAGPAPAAALSTEALMARDLAAWRLAKDAIAKASRRTP